MLSAAVQIGQHLVAAGGVLSERGDRVDIMFNAILKELDSAVWVMAIEYQNPWLTRRSNSSISPPKLDRSLRTSTYFSFVHLSKFLASHSSPSTLSAHPVFGQEKVAFSWAWTAACHPIRWEDPLYMYIGSSTLTSAEIHSMTVAISQLPSCM